MEYLCDTLREPTVTSLIPQVSCSFRFCLSLSLSLPLLPTCHRTRGRNTDNTVSLLHKDQAGDSS